MAYICQSSGEAETEVVISEHNERRWRRREEELIRWSAAAKPRRRPKQTAYFGGAEIDAELLAALSLFKRMGIDTEFSCAGVSLLDEPEDHSLYAYITFPATDKTEAFVRLAQNRMKHRLLVTFEPGRNRFDLSSFYIGHNRSYCLLIERCAKQMMEQLERNAARILE
ncbi:hypothetical protein [Paenibacillus arenilitoris]|uniref:Uncharacterized protein n=1 Tax=Paenibacillus arenilitoris TaxID=2772299 RepID=A0A927CMT3_9BACL|nr:hypothetical protein [Paenibacillus arenilitoris]MBD2868480.1 hypothetical protein [Paenibacillus arenilitoris]